MAYGARLEIVLGVKALAGSNPASSATYQHRDTADASAQPDNYQDATRRSSSRLLP